MQLVASDVVVVLCISCGLCLDPSSTNWWFNHEIKALKVEDLLG